MPVFPPNKVILSMKSRKRCSWCDENSELYVHYHDSEWGVPLTDDARLYEMLVLEGMQAGLSWLTILKKRENFSRALNHFDYRTIAAYDDAKIAELLNNQGIIRNRLKLESTVKNARVFLSLCEDFGSFAKYLWGYVDYQPIQNSFAQLKDLPAQTELSKKISKDLKKRGMNFVGPTIMYAFMQATGMVNDHTTDCFRYQECAQMKTTVKEKFDSHG
jgi:DNA-3-methyladenine glycosylase I